MVRSLIERLSPLGIEVYFDKVSDRNKQHRMAHSMSKQAWNQVFTKEAWRPEDAPPKPESRESDDDIPF